MAQFLTPLNGCLNKMQAGEKRFAKRLEQFLEDDYQCWYDLAVGKRQRYADFIIVHPARGVLLLELKDWHLDTIKQIDKNSVTLLLSTGLKTVANPLEQARQCSYQLVRQLEQDQQLTHQVGKHQGKLAFPYGYGVVLSNITRDQYIKVGLCEVIPQNRVLCKDEMTESFDPEDFQQCLWNMFEYQFKQKLTLPQLDRIRWHLFPELRIGQQASLFMTDSVTEVAADFSIPDILKVMDIQQEQLARSLGAGHRVIHGVAGSGKTLILGFRCLYLAKILHKPILVLCYNIALAARLRVLMQEKGIADKVNVYHFHDWCGELLRHYHIDRPSSQGEQYLDDLVTIVNRSIEQGRIPRGQYGAIMIDEGHDFQASWLRLVSSLTDPEKDYLLLLYDDAQSIYSKNKQLHFSLSSVGIQARGRTTVLKLNYRNTEEVFSLASEFATHYVQAAPSDEDHIPLLEAKSAGRHGVAPELRQFESFELEVEKITSWLRQWHQQRQLNWADMCILYRSKWQGTHLYEAIQTAKIPCQWLSSQAAKKQFDPQQDSVKLMTMHSSKGLEFPLVVIAGLGFMPEAMSEIELESKLLYVAMTRSTEKLLLTYHQETPFTELLIKSFAKQEQPHVALGA
jgi:hypothetical protein